MIIKHCKVITISKKYMGEKFNFNNKIKNVVEKTKMVTYGAIALFMVNCTGPNAPSNKTVLEHIDKNPKTEKASLQTLNYAKETHTALKEFMKGKSDKTLDIKLETGSQFDKDPKFNQFPQEYKATLKNDSTVVVDFKGTDVLMYQGQENQYTPNTDHSEIIFHNNGNIEINENSKYTSTETRKNVNENINMEIDGGSGAFIRYAEISPETKQVMKYFLITKDGKIDQSTNYEYGIVSDRMNTGTGPLNYFYAIKENLK